MLPPYIFSGAEFALIPSRDEPFGLVAVEFGRKGALGVGARVGGLGNMPGEFHSEVDLRFGTNTIAGWWFTIESTTTKHLIAQFKTAIRSALSSKDDVRALMRARSGMQRFPVVQWIEDLEILQARSIQAHDKQASGSSSMFRFSSRAPSRANSTSSSAANTEPSTRPGTRPQSRIASPIHSPIQSRAPSPIREDDTADHEGGTPPAISPTSGKFPLCVKRSLMRKNASPNISRNNSFNSFQDMSAIANSNVPTDVIREGNGSPVGGITIPRKAHLPSQMNMTQAVATPSVTGRSTPPHDESPTDHFSPPFPSTKSKSVLSLQSIVGEQKDFHLQKTDPFFTDTTGVYYHNFEKMLDGVDSKNSTDRYCIEKFLEKSEKQWFGQRHNAKLGLSIFSSPRSSIYEHPRESNASHGQEAVTEEREVDPAEDLEQFNLGHDFVPIKGIRKLLQRKIGDWQIYSLILAFVSSHLMYIFSFERTDISRVKSLQRTRIKSICSQAQTENRQ